MGAPHTLAWLAGKPTFSRGIHPPTRKQNSAHKPIEVLPAPSAVMVPLHQHAGAPAHAVVGPRASVVVGDLIGRASEAGISASVHAPIAGKVRPITSTTLPNGRRSLAVPIQAARQAEQALAGRALWDQLFGNSWPLEELPSYGSQEIIAAVRDAGIVGLGGAAFPTHLKLTARPDQPIETVLLNGCECEPYLTSDYRLMIEAPQPISAGLRLAMQACGARRAIVAIEDNKPAAAQSMRRGLERLEHVELVICQTKYPMGGERQLIPAVLGREVPTDGFPTDIGILVINVATAAAIATAVLRGNKLTHRVLSISGQGIREPKNLLVPVGTPLKTVLDYCGGLCPDAQRVIAGGPMMGFSVSDLSVPITKATGGITVLSSNELQRFEQTTCIRCGKCIDVCPLGLAPTRISHAAKFRHYELAKTYNLQACCECGCCAYICPSRIPLVQFIRAGKSELMRR